MDDGSGKRYWAEDDVQSVAVHQRTVRSPNFFSYRSPFLCYILHKKPKNGCKNTFQVQVRESKKVDVEQELHINLHDRGNDQCT